MGRGESGQRIFVSYRDDDTGVHVQHLCLHLRKAFPDDVFWAETSIRRGANWQEEAVRALQKTVVVMVVVIGKSWIHDRDDGKRGPSEAVLFELGMANERNEKVASGKASDLTKIEFLTVTVGGTPMPKKHDVPENDRALVAPILPIKAIKLSTDDHLELDYDELVREIRAKLQAHEQRKAEVEAKADEALIGTVVNDYNIVKRIGGGAMGTVYLAEHPTIGRKAAVKVLHPELAKNLEMFERFINEARATNLRPHPGIVEIINAGVLRRASHPPAPYLLMEYLEGSTLGHRLTQKRRFDVDEAIYYASEVADALSAMHTMGIVHRDLKPENVFLVDDKRSPYSHRVKVLDFGVAKFLAPDTNGVSKTMSGSLFGTPQYMAPEQWSSSDVDDGVDIYALGAVLYEMLCGQPPFGRKQLKEIILAHEMREAPRMPRSINPTIPLPLEAVIVKALAPERAERFASMGEMLGALKALSVRPPAAETPAVGPEPMFPPPRGRGTTMSTAAVEAPPPQRRSATSWAVMGIGALVVAVVALMKSQHSGIPPLPKRVHIRIDSDPKDALVFNRIDGALLGSTSFDYERKPGESLSVVLKKDRFEPLPLNIPLDTDYAVAETLREVKSPPPPAPPPATGGTSGADRTTRPHWRHHPEGRARENGPDGAAKAVDQWRAPSELDSQSIYIPGGRPEQFERPE